MNQFIDLAKLLPRAINKYQVQRQTRAAHICKRFRDLSPDLIGKDSLEHIRPKFFKGNTLYVSVPNSLWAQRVYVHRHDLIMKLNLDLDKDYVHEIRTLVEGAVGAE